MQNTLAPFIFTLKFASKFLSKSALELASKTTPKSTFRSASKSTVGSSFKLAPKSLLKYAFRSGFRSSEYLVFKSIIVSLLKCLECRLFWLFTCTIVPSFVSIEFRFVLYFALRLHEFASFQDQFRCPELLLF